MIIRIDAGKFEMGNSMKIQGIVSVMEAEARDVQKALDWIEDLWLQGVIIESDSEMVVKAMNDNKSYNLKRILQIEVYT